MQTLIINQQFIKDASEGLKKYPKQISSKYFYDAEGDRLFQKIMEMPEYYLTNCEFEVFEKQKEDILQSIDAQCFDLIELGAGDGTKTKVLLEYFLFEGANFRYVPIDISQNILDELEVNMRAQLPTLNILPMQGDYFKILKDLPSEKGRKKVILFLGSNIGNYSHKQTMDFISALGDELESGEFLMIGVDLKKDPQIIQNAYDDPAGITETFNLNLLTRINKELGGNFDISAFKHWETYNPITGEARSYIVSKKEQKVFIEALGEEFEFEAWEAIHTEISRKYSVRELESLARRTGFEVTAHFLSKNDFYVDTLWRKM